MANLKIPKLRAKKSICNIFESFVGKLSRKLRQYMPGKTLADVSEQTHPRSWLNGQNWSSAEDVRDFKELKVSFMFQVLVSLHW